MVVGAGSENSRLRQSHLLDKLEVRLDGYRLRPDKQKGWKIIDVLLNGTVSELALRRSEYSSLIQREGFAALMTALNQRIDDLAGGKVPNRAS